MTGDFNSVRIADVAAECGYAKGLLFYYFKSKENIFLKLLEREYDRRYSRIIGMISDKQKLSFDGFSKIILDEMRETLDFKSSFMRLMGLTNMLINNATKEALEAFRSRTAFNFNKLVELISSRVQDISFEKCMNIFYTENALLSGINELAGVSKEKADTDFADYTKIVMQSMKYYLKGVKDN